MFNALRTDELLVGIGRVLRIVADAPGALEEYERSQTLSAYSVTRLLAAEQAAARELLVFTREALLGVFDAAAPRPELGAVRQRIELASTGTEIGEALSELLDSVRRDDPIRAPVHAVLAEMIDREVAALAGPPR
jgi:hypothetical protein